MAEEIINSQVTEENSESNGYSSEKAFEGKLSLPGNIYVVPENQSISSDSCHDGYSPRRNSTGKPNPKTSTEKIVPRYLRASTGSCHDFCKYGRKHASDDQEIRPWWKRTAKAQSNKQNPAISVPSEEMKSATVLKQMRSSHRTENPAVTEPWGERKKATAPWVERKKATPVQEMTLSPGRQNPAVTASLGEMKKATVLKQMTSPDRTQSPAAATPLGDRKKATMLKQMTSPGRTHNPAFTAPLVERKKTMVCKEMASPDRGRSPEMTVPSEEKKKAMVRKEMASPDSPALVRKEMASPAREHSPAMAIHSGEKKKSMVHKQMASPDRKQSPAMAVHSEEKKKAMVRKQMASADRQQSPEVAVRLREKTMTTVKQLTSHDRISVSLKHKSSPAAIKSEDHPEIIKKGVFLPLKKVKASSKDSSPHKKSEVEKRMNRTSSKRPPAVRPPLIRQLSSFRSLSSAKKTEKAEKMTESVSPKSSPSVVQQPAMPKSSSSIRTSEALCARGKRRSNTVTSKNRVVVTKASTKKVLVLPIVSSAPKIRINMALKGKKSKSSKLVSSLVDQNSEKKTKMGKAENENVPERTLHAIATESESQLSESTADNKVIPPLLSQSSLSPKSSSKWQCPSFPSQENGEAKEEVGGGIESEEEIDDTDSANEEEEMYMDEDGYSYEEEVDEILPVKDGMTNDNGMKAVEVNARKNLRKTSVISDTKDPTPVKIKFRRGRVVDIQSTESNAPRRLRFRQRKVIDEKHNQHFVSEIRRKNFKKKVAADDGGGDGHVPKASNEKVVLRHQDMQGKKDEQGLFNNVIEETASKLVESRKSKVKALVGAFETVISLQDIKPSSQTAS